VLVSWSCHTIYKLYNLINEFKTLRRKSKWNGLSEGHEIWLDEWLFSYQLPTFSRATGWFAQGTTGSVENRSLGSDKEEFKVDDVEEEGLHWEQRGEQKWEISSIIGEWTQSIQVSHQDSTAVAQLSIVLGGKVWDKLWTLLSRSLTHAKQEWVQASAAFLASRLETGGSRRFQRGRSFSLRSVTAEAYCWFCQVSRSDRWDNRREREDI